MGQPLANAKQHGDPAESTGDFRSRLSRPSDDAKFTPPNTGAVPASGGESHVAHHRDPINKTPALVQSLNSIATEKSLPFWTCQSILSSDVINVPDIQDDLQRELAFYRQSLAAARVAGKALGDEEVVMTRPTDFFAEMVKSDQHMQTIRSNLANHVFKRNLAAEMRKQRERKAFGKAVQVAKFQERQRAQKDAMSMVQLAKRKRKRGSEGALHPANATGLAADRPTSGFISKSDPTDRKYSSGRKRLQKDNRFGFGGKKRHAKSGDARSSGDLGDFSTGKTKGQSIRKLHAGKSKRFPV